MPDFPSFALLDKTGAIQPTIVPSDATAIDSIKFYLERSGYHTELRKFFQVLQQTFSLSEVPAGSWTLTAITASGSSAVEGASATVTVTASETAIVTLTAATGFSDPTGSTQLNRGNSYAWLGDAKGYFDNRFGASAWDALSDSDKESLIITATADIDRTLRFHGKKLDSGQLLSFPRFLRRGEIIDPNDMRFIPREIMEGMLEQAWMINNNGSPDSKRKDLQAEGVTSLSMGRVSENYDSSYVDRPKIAARAMEKLYHWIQRTHEFGSFSEFDPQ